MKRKKLDESEWSKVFDLRCRSKRGEYLRPEDMALCERALQENPKRYSGLQGKVFEATKPFGAR